MAALRREAFILPGRVGGRFCVVTRPNGEPKGQLLLAPPFAEELNKSRRMLALAAEAFAERGWLVLRTDLFGCGDSAGDFGDAGWGDWLDDLELAHDWLAANARAPIGLWSLRAGSLLVADWLARSGRSLPWLAWQPVTNGKQHLQQFLRLKGVSEMLNEADVKETMSALRAQIAAGQAVEVAGYTLSPALVAGMEAASLSLLPGYAAPVSILELSGQSEPSSSPAVRMLVERTKASGASVDAAAMQGVSFWQTQEIEVARPLIEASCEVLTRWAHAR